MLLPEPLLLPLLELLFFELLLLELLSLLSEPADLGENKASMGCALTRMEAYVMPGTALCARVCKGRFGSASLRTR